ncbi:8660_t:CDS:2 [Gigaspora rosea]|nr:8660_t:CDS:2 [Gigaspora rosea]
MYEHDPEKPEQYEMPSRVGISFGHRQLFKYLRIYEAYSALLL